MAFKDAFPAGLFSSTSQRKEALIAFREDLAQIIQENVQGLIEGGQGDLAIYANAIADDVIRVMEWEPERRDKYLAELQGQLKLIGEANRLRATHAAWDAVGRIVSATVGTAVKLIIPG